MARPSKYKTDEERIEGRRLYYINYNKNKRKLNTDKIKLSAEEKRLKKKAYMKEYLIKNREKLNAQSIEYNSKHSSVLKELSKQNYYKNRNHNIARNKEYKKNNKEKLRKSNNDYVKRRKKVDPLFALKIQIRSNILKTFSERSFTKSNNTVNILGCSFIDFKLHLESKFESWMNWDNRGKYKKDVFNYGWDIDHIIPISTATCEADVIRLNHYTNLQPLCSKINRDVKRSN